MMQFNTQNPVFVALIGTTGFLQSFINYTTPLVQLLISICTLLYVFQKWRNEKNKK
ncbi:hypothetical protein [Tenacibaculum ovolyticum]|uniref:hypothetical protein n=1 Tax=Tenacibaculum ovolyticum TaxID=104270 RepID=UPI0012FA84BB|nr:hypothetical protein [Tenacibaculum ovolyticum]